MTWTGSVYTVTRSFPADERFGLTSQLQRSAVSFPSNIAQGWGRNTKAEYRQFLRYARGSLFEAQTQIELAGSSGTSSRHTWTLCKKRATSSAGCFWA